MTTASLPKLLRRPDVMAMTGLSHATLYRDKTFPRPVRIGVRASAWLESEVAAWIATRVSQRDAGQKPADRNQEKALATRMAKLRGGGE